MLFIQGTWITNWISIGHFWDPSDEDKNEDKFNGGPDEDNDDLTKEHAPFTRAAWEDEDDMDNFGIEKPRAVTDVKLAKTIGKQIILFYVDSA